MLEKGNTLESVEQLAKDKLITRYTASAYIRGNENNFDGIFNPSNGSDELLTLARYSRHGGVRRADNRCDEYVGDPRRSL
jgi:hypothetical protein